MVIFLAVLKIIEMLNLNPAPSNLELDLEINENYEIREIIKADVLKDDSQEILISLWKTGNYGEKQPFWVEENDQSYKMHLFVYNKDLKAIWQSSNLPYENIKIFPINLDNDKKLELLCIQREYNSLIPTIGLWKWQGWGFVSML